MIVILVHKHLQDPRPTNRETGAEKEWQRKEDRSILSVSRISGGKMLLAFVFSQLALLTATDAAGGSSSRKARRRQTDGQREQDRESERRTGRQGRQVERRRMKTKEASAATEQQEQEEEGWEGEMLQDREKGKGAKGAARVVTYPCSSTATQATRTHTWQEPTCMNRT